MLPKQPVVATVPPQDTTINKPAIDRYKKPEIKETNVILSAEVRPIVQSSMADSSLILTPTTVSAPKTLLVNDSKPQDKAGKSDENVQVTKKVQVPQKPADVVKADSGSTTSVIINTSEKPNSGLSNEEVSQVPSKDLVPISKSKENWPSQNATKKLIKTPDTRTNAQKQENMKKSKPRGNYFHKYIRAIVFISVFSYAIEYFKILPSECFWNYNKHSI